MARFFGRDKPTYQALLVGAEKVTRTIPVILIAISFTLTTRPFRKREEMATGAAAAAAAGGGRRLLRWSFSLGHLAGFNTFWYSHHLLIVVYLLLSLRTARSLPKRGRGRRIRERGSRIRPWRGWIRATAAPAHRPATGTLRHPAPAYRTRASQFAPPPPGSRTGFWRPPPTAARWAREAGWVGGGG